MFVVVRAKKRQQTLECRPSSLLSAAQLNRDFHLSCRIFDSGTRVFHLSVVQEKTCFNSSKGSRIQSLAPTVIDTHYSTLRRTHLHYVSCNQRGKSPRRLPHLKVGVSLEKKDKIMKIKKILSQNRRDFTALYECEHCGHEHEGSGYDDANFHNNVIPKRECPECGKVAPEDHRPLAPKYAADEII